MLFARSRNSAGRVPHSARLSKAPDLSPHCQRLLREAVCGGEPSPDSPSPGTGSFDRARTMPPRSVGRCPPGALSSTWRSVRAGSVAGRGAPRTHLATRRGFGEQRWGSWLQLRGSSGNRGAGGPLDFFAPCRSPRSPGPRAHSRVRALVRELRAAFVGTLPFRSGSWRPPEVCFPLEKSTRQREGQRAAGRPEGRRSASLSQFWGLETIT